MLRDFYARKFFLCSIFTSSDLEEISKAIIFKERNNKFVA